MGAQQDDVEWRDRWPEVLVHTQTDAALDFLEQYYAADDDGTTRYTGARFEAIAALNEDPNTIGPADFVAASMLSVNVPPKAAIRLLGPDAETITDLLRQIPPDSRIVDVSSEALGPASAAGKLWKLLRDGRDGVGPTKTSKLLAAKRPSLLPIWDSFVNEATGLGTLNYWERFQHVLIADDMRIWNWLGDLRSHAPSVPAEASDLRILDVLLWMSVKRG